MKADAAEVGCLLEMAAGECNRLVKDCAGEADWMYERDMTKASLLDKNGLAKRDFAPAASIVKGRGTGENTLPETGALYESRSAKVNVTLKVNVFEMSVSFKEGVFEIRLCSKDGTLKIDLAGKARV